jgi:hypothetical protein
MSKSDPRVSSLEFVSEEELRGEIPAGPSDDRAQVDSPTVAKPRVGSRAAAVQPDVDAGLAPLSEIVAPLPTRPSKPVVKHPPMPAVAPQPASTGLPSDVVPAIAGPSPGAGGGAGRRSRTMPALPYRTHLAGQDRSFDLSLPEDVVELLDALSKEPMKRVVEIYGDLQRAAATADSGAAGHLRGLLGRITMQSQDRGFLPREDRVYAECLHYTRLDPRNIIHDDALRRHKGEVDIAPMVEPLYDVQPAVRRNLRMGPGSSPRRHPRAGPACHAGGVSRSIPSACPQGREGGRTRTRSAGARGAVADGDFPACVPHFDYHKERLLTELYRTRLVAQVAEAAKAFDDAMMGRNFAEYCSGGRSALHRDEEAAAQLRLAALKRKLAAFEADPARTIRAASPLDFLPASVTERDVAGPKVFCAPDVTGFRSPDKAAQMLEAILWERLWVRVRKPRQTQPEQQQPSQPTPMKQIDRTAGREFD